MKTIIKILAQVSAVAALLLTITPHTAWSQLLVDSKNINEDLEVEYIQLMYYIDQRSFKPIYLVDYGTDLQNVQPKNQELMIGDLKITANVSPVMILNKLHKNGWEYMGDFSHISVPLMENLFCYTLKRRHSPPSAVSAKNLD